MERSVGTLARLGLFDEASGALALQGIKKPELYRSGFYLEILFSNDQASAAFTAAKLGRSLGVAVCSA